MAKTVRDLRILLVGCLSALALSIALSACERDTVSTNPADLLSFSTDTLSFDTVFQTIGSSTRFFWIRNLNERAVETSVRLQSKGRSGFRINVDGFPVTDQWKTTIRGKDSICVFVEVTVDPADKNNPLLIYDAVETYTHQSKQEVTLTAYGRQVEIWKGKYIPKDTTLTDKTPILVYGTLVVMQDATLTLTPGTQLYFHKDALMQVNGKVLSLGTTDRPVVLRGDRLDNLLSDIPYDWVSGQWEGVLIAGNSYGNKFINTRIRNGNFGIFADLSESIFEQKAFFENTIITNVVNTPLTAVNCWIEAVNSEFSNGGQGAVMLLGGKYSFNYCTFTDYYKWQSRAKIPVLYLTNYLQTQDQILLLPLTQADFSNSVVYGSSDKELGLENKIGKDSIPGEFNYTFYRCLIKGTVLTTPRFVSVRWNENPKFLDIGNNYHYDFRPDSLSVLRHKGDSSMYAPSGSDLYGHPRPIDKGGDLGAYQWTPSQKKP